MSIHQLFIYISLHLSALCTIAVMSAITNVMSDCKAAIVDVLKSYYPPIEPSISFNSFQSTFLLIASRILSGIVRGALQYQYVWRL